MITHRASVLGDPIEHSKSPLIHNTGYQALGMDDWEYTAIQCPEGDLPSIVSAADDSVAGFSVTMPGKFDALNFADEVTERARLVGSANTLVRTETGWLADNTDADGVAGALREVGVESVAGGTAIVVGAGGTARPAVWALAQAGITHLIVVARSERAYNLEPLATELGMTFHWVPFTDQNLADVAGTAEVLVSTVPSEGLVGYNGQLARAKRIVDVIYDPWPTPLVEAARRTDTPAVGGLTMLLHQALGQFEQFTGRTAPEKEMREKLFELL
ncbi:shikimate dehydrogenase [Corynebacterium sputi]|uniref:shikimate dehydrogenase n=1 Tax=Corynebacterium sputi TaxID=489915 RepID=UPI000418D2CE|nr:shikimate dehydrogenase [Corynebacterium sputi]